MKVSSISSISSYRTTNYTNQPKVKLNQPMHLNANSQKEISFGSKATWKGLVGAVVGSIIAGPIGAALLGATCAGYGAIEDELDEDKKNGTDWDQMPDIA